MKKLMIVLLIFYSAEAFTQVNGRADSYWFDGSLGGDNLGINGGVSINYMHKSTVFRLRYLGSEEFQIFGPSPSETVNDVGILFGKTYTKKYIQLVASGGMGFITGIKRGNYLYSEGGLFGTGYYQRERVYGMGIPVELEFQVRPFRYAGLGMGVFGDLNTYRSLYGVQFKLLFGKLR
jgi:hypothetical protein